MHIRHECECFGHPFNCYGHPTNCPCNRLSAEGERIAELEAALKHIADPLAFHTIQEMREIAKSVL